MDVGELELEMSALGNAKDVPVVVAAREYPRRNRAAGRDGGGAFVAVVGFERVGRGDEPEAELVRVGGRDAGNVGDANVVNAGHGDGEPEPIGIAAVLGLAILEGIEAGVEELQLRAVGRGDCEVQGEFTGFGHGESEPVGIAGEGAGHRIGADGDGIGGREVVIGLRFGGGRGVGVDGANRIPRKVSA